MKVDKVTYKIGSHWLLLSYAISFVGAILIPIYLDKGLGYELSKFFFILLFCGLWWLLSRPGKLLLMREVTASFGESAIAISWSEHAFLKDKGDVVIPFDQIKKYKISSSQSARSIRFWLLNGKKRFITIPSHNWETEAFFNSFDLKMREGDFPDLIIKPPFEKTKTALIMAWVCGLILVFFLAAYFITKPKGENWGVILVSFISVWTFIWRVIKARRKNEK